MAELPIVSPGEIIASGHINDIAERTVQRYADATERDLLNPTPAEGQLAYLDDTKQVLIFNGTNWVVGGTGGSDSLTLEGSSNQLVVRNSGTLQQTNFNQASDELRFRTGTTGNLLTVLTLTATEIRTDDVDFHTKRDSTQTQIVMENSSGTHYWRFRILGTGQLQLQSAPIGTTTWTLVEQWVNA